MAQLNSTKYKNNVRVVAGVPQIFSNDVVLLCDTSLGPVTINLLDIPIDYWSTQWKLYVIDNSNNASVNNITVVAGVGQLVNGVASFNINVNGGYSRLTIGSNGKYLSTNSFGGGGGAGGYSLIQDEGVALPVQTVLDFVGAGVLASNGPGAKTTVTIPGGAISFFTLTNANLLALITAGTAVPGAFYLVTDPGFCDEGVIVQAVKTFSNTTLQGSGIYLNADYQMVGNYTGVPGFGSAKGLWSDVAVPVIAGDCVVYDNLNYKNLTGVWGTAPSTDVVNWVVLAKSVTTGYIREVDFVKYNVVTNQVIYRADKRLNEVDLFIGGAFGYNSLLTFQWGRSEVIQNKVQGESVFYCINSYVHQIGNIVNNGTIQDTLTNSVAFGFIGYNEVSSGGLIEAIRTQGSIVRNIVTGRNSTLICQPLGGIPSTQPGSLIENNRIESGGIIRFQTLLTTGTIENCEVNRGSLMQFVTSSGIMNTCLLQNTGTMSLQNISVGGGYRGCEVSDKLTYSYSANIVLLYEYKKLKIDYSNWEIVLDMSDPAVYDLITSTLTIPLVEGHCGIFYLSNIPPGAIILNIVNCPQNHKCTFRPNPLLTVIFRHTLVGLAVGNQLLCDAPASSNLLTGRVNGSDFIEYKTGGNLLLRTNLVLVA